MHEEWIIYLLELKEYLFELEALGLKNTSEWCDANEAVWQVENYLQQSKQDENRNNQYNLQVYSARPCRIRYIPIFNGATGDDF